MECERRKVYVEVNVTHRPDGTARPNSIKFENDEISAEPPLLRSVAQAFAIRFRFADSRLFCSMKKTESGLSKQNPNVRRAK